jgi:hypothetical protein
MWKVFLIGFMLATASFGKSVKTCVNEAFEAAAKENEKLFVPSVDNDDSRFDPGPYSLLTESQIVQWSEDERFQAARVYVLKVRTSGCCGAKTVTNSFKVIVSKSLTCEIRPIQKIDLTSDNF